MATFPVRPSDADWKDPRFISSWKATRLRTLEEQWQQQWKPLFDGIPLAARRDESIFGVFSYVEETILREGESLSERARRIEEKEERGRNRSRRSVYSVQSAIGKDDAGDFVIVEWAKRATPVSIECAKYLYELGLEKKAQRRIACDVLWAVRNCANRHRWKMRYQCGNRYCQNCGPRRVNKILGESVANLTPVAAAIREQNRSAVTASIDFTWRNTGKMPEKEEIRFFNSCIKKCFRILEKKFGFTRRDYGVMWCDEFGGKNTNLHAHGVYVGPWIPQSKRNKQLSKAWAKATRGIATIASIKLRPDLAGAVAHAVKYPAKYVELSTPERLAELELAFHKVRRLHKLARFYKVEIQESENQLDFCACPICHSPLSEIVEWVPLDQVRDVPDLDEYVLRRRVQTGAGPPGQ